MPRWSAAGVFFLTVLFWSTATSADAAVKLEVSDDVVQELRGEAGHQYILATTNEVLIEVENLGRGTILTVSSESGEHVLRAANWRGIEGRYRALVSADAPLTLEVAPDQPVAPTGNYRISVTPSPPGEHARDGELAMTRGSDLLLQHYFGEADSRNDALLAFEDAIAAFRQAGLSDRVADALFEAAGVHFNTGEHDEAADYYRQAEEIWVMLGDWRGVSAAQQLQGLVAWRTGKHEQAISFFEQTANRRKTLGDSFFYAQASNNLGLVYRSLNDARGATSRFEDALDGWQGSVDLLQADVDAIDFDRLEQPPWLFDSLVAINNLSWATELLGEYHRSKDLLERGLALSTHLSRDRIGARIRSNLGRINFKMGDLDAALHHLEVALHYFKTQAPNELWAGNIHHSIAEVYATAGDPVRATYELKEALRLRTNERDPVSRAESILALAELELENEEIQEVSEHVGDALELLPDENYRLRARSRNLRARAHRRANRFTAAIIDNDATLELYALAGDMRGEAGSRVVRAGILGDSGEHGDSVEEWLSALNLATSIEDRLLEFRTLAGLSEEYVRAGDYGKAQKTAESALALSEEVREEIRHPSLLRYFARTQRTAYDVLVHSLIQSDNVESAWQASDRSRARRFWDELSRLDESSNNWNEERRLQYEDLVHRRAARADELSQLLSASGDQDDNLERIATVRTELASIVSSIDAIRGSAIDAAVRGSRPTLELGPLQSLLSDSEALVEFHISELAAGAWIITRDDISYRSIPRAANLAKSIVSSIEGLKRRESVKSRLRDLSRQLLGSGQELSGDIDRLIVVPDGPLHLLPFAALPDPATDFQAPLLERLTVSLAPSSAIYASLSRDNRSDSTGIAVLADPIFDDQDPRVSDIELETKFVAYAAIDPLLERSPGNRSQRQFARLPGTLAESQVIQALSRDEETLVATGTDASLDTVLSGGLDDFRIVHFATHGIVDPEEPSLSGLVLSGISADGQAQRRFLRAQDIAGLQLNAELVVLSGCDTGLGRLAHGEGIDGLSRAFFSAGVPQVVSSLWQVPDRATAELMKHFYKAMLVEGMKPDAALRHAQLTISTEPRWSNPYYWASFIVQGGRQ